MAAHEMPEQKFRVITIYWTALSKFLQLTGNFAIDFDFFKSMLVHSSFDFYEQANLHAELCFTF